MSYILLLALLGALSAATAKDPDAGKNTVITILYSGDTYGQLESCG